MSEHADEVKEEKKTRSERLDAFLNNYEDKDRIKVLEFFDLILFHIILISLNSMKFNSLITWNIIKDWLIQFMAILL